MTIIEQVRRLDAECLELPVASLDVDMEMDGIVEWDSMRNVMILSAVEDTFGIMIPEDDIFELTSVRAIAEEVEKVKELS